MLILIMTSQIWYIVGWLKIQKLEYLIENNFSMKQKNLNLCLPRHILRSYRFVAEVTFKGLFFYIMIWQDFKVSVGNPLLICILSETFSRHGDHIGTYLRWRKSKKLPQKMASLIRLHILLKQILSIQTYLVYSEHNVHSPIYFLHTLSMKELVCSAKTDS